MKRGKHSQSEIVSAVLLILLVIVAAMIVMGIVIPLVKNKLSSADCLDVAGKIEISDNQYTCYNDSGDNLNLQIHILDIADLIEGFKVELGGVSSKAVDIKTDGAGFVMYGNGNFELPKNNEARTYIILNVSEKSDYIKIYALLKNGKVCDSPDMIDEIENCR